MRVVIYPNETVALFDGHHGTPLEKKAGIREAQSNWVNRLVIEDDAQDGLITVKLNDKVIMSVGDMVYDSLGQSGIWIKGNARISDFRVEPMQQHIANPNEPQEMHSEERLVKEHNNTIEAENIRP